MFCVLSSHGSSSLEWRKVVGKGNHVTQREKSTSELTTRCPASYWTLVK